MNLRSDELYRRLAEKLDAMSISVAQRVISGVSSHSLVHAGTSRSRSSDERMRKIPPITEKMHFFDLLLQKDKNPFVVQWTLATTIYAFTRAYGSTSTWVPRAARQQMEAHSDLFQDVSGLSVLFFAVEPGHTWARYHGKVGKMWSYVLRNSISSAILSVRARDFDSPRTAEEKRIGRKVPAWLNSFGGKAETAATVGEIIQCLETTEEMTRRTGDVNVAMKRKRMRLQEPPVDEYESERDYCVRELRSAMLSTWTYGRSEARKILSETVMFLVEKIRSYPTVLDAKEDGYEIVFHSACSCDENCVPEELVGTVWDIPMVIVHSEGEEEICNKNNLLLKDLADRFPSLRLTLRYKRAIVCMDPTMDSSSVPPFWDAEETVSLHQLSLTILTASLSGKSIQSILRTSSLSLRAVHVLAIGLRGLVYRSIGMEPLDLDKCALGGVTCEEISNDDGDRVTTFAANRMSSRAARSSVGSSQNGGKSNFKISLASYRAEEQRIREARRQQERSSRSEARQMDACGGSDSDIGDTWLEGFNNS